MMKDYTFIVEPLSEEDGGGFFVTFPDLPGCQSDGDTVEEAIANAQDAFDAWVAAQTERGIDIPQPGDAWSDARGAFEKMQDTIAQQSEEIERLKTEIAALGASRRRAAGRWTSIKATGGGAYRVNPVLAG